jgi:hypothetical protein
MQAKADLHFKRHSAQTQRHTSPQSRVRAHPEPTAPSLNFPSSQSASQCSEHRVGGPLKSHEVSVTTICGDGTCPLGQEPSEVVLLHAASVSESAAAWAFSIISREPSTAIAIASGAVPLWM